MMFDYGNTFHLTWVGVRKVWMPDDPKLGDFKRTFCGRRIKWFHAVEQWDRTTRWWGKFPMCKTCQHALDHG